MIRNAFSKFSLHIWALSINVDTLERLKNQRKLLNTETD